jgi:hypothetical protein
LQALGKQPIFSKYTPQAIRLGMSITPKGYYADINPEYRDIVRYALAENI